MTYQLKLARHGGDHIMISVRQSNWPQRITVAYYASANHDLLSLWVYLHLHFPEIYPMSGTLDFSAVTANDLENLADIRVAAMRESLERVGRFDENRARQRMRDQFNATATQSINLNGERVGFYCMTHEADGLHLHNFYLLPSVSGQGLGSRVLRHLMDVADAQNQPMHLAALRDSDANRFYVRHGFVLAREEEWDLYYTRPALTVKTAAPL
ncbi:GNAT family N-acetyltransferase [Silvimonas soli]|uniref:GNAT family N-acetyltransferase n=1 Tax=Silvimonas soli TaxID=2980100 RepID=UPI0024B38500|nr:GNAT family N-acetyltransferase [Silvimonas soli]